MQHLQLERRAPPSKRSSSTCLPVCSRPPARPLAGYTGWPVQVRSTRFLTLSRRYAVKTFGSLYWLIPRRNSVTPRGSVRGEKSFCAIVDCHRGEYPWPTTIRPGVASPERSETRAVQCRPSSKMSPRGCGTLRREKSRHACE